ncbi:hypothetical protein [Actinopolyspora saharensis]|uniref:Uncharacterized protein n=1 Tax=Actinopolyspora saharensis TaxID=995062 RepID=A0A1H1DVB6_9ACTN|nr:hypothetical protein [Actinopolyspora saharensis]SDQ80425.1 hypothetical protein SAMN04489718_2254 [Actinopolyspora saharensis]
MIGFTGEIAHPAQSFTRMRALGWGRADHSRAVELSLRSLRTVLHHSTNSRSDAANHIKIIDRSRAVT